MLRQNPDADLPRCHADGKGENDRSLITSAKLPTVVWPNKATVALNIVVNVEEGSEYSHAAGDSRNEGGACVRELKQEGMCQVFAMRVHAAQSSERAAGPTAFLR